MITLNEEDNLPGALENAKTWAEDIFVVDSRSTDRTVDIVLEHGVKIVQRPFTNFGDHWNWTLTHLPVTTPWIFIQAPDERLSPELIESIREELRDDPKHDGYIVKSRWWILGTPINQVRYPLRFARTGKCRVSPVLVNEHLLVDGTVGNLKGTMEHIHSHCFYRLLEKQSRYSTIRAIEMHKKMPSAVKGRLFGSKLERRMFLKDLFFHLPGRYILYWIYLAIFQRAILSGYPGLVWVRWRIDSLKWAEITLYEIKKTGKVPKLPKASHGDFDPRILETELQKSVYPQ